MVFAHLKSKRKPTEVWRALYIMLANLPHSTLTAVLESVVWKIHVVIIKMKHSSGLSIFTLHWINSLLIKEPRRGSTLVALVQGSSVCLALFVLYGPHRAILERKWIYICQEALRKLCHKFLSPFFFSPSLADKLGLSSNRRFSLQNLGWCSSPKMRCLTDGLGLPSGSQSSFNPGKSRPSSFFWPIKPHTSSFQVLRCWGVDLSRFQIILPWGLG